MLNGLPCKWTKIILLFLRLHPSTAFWTAVDCEGYSISSKGLLSTVVDIMVIWIKFAHSHPFNSLILKCQCLLLPSPVWTHPIYLDLGPNIPSSCAVLFFTASDFTFTTRYIHTWALFALWLSLFTLSGAISLLFPSRVLDTYWPAGTVLIFQFHIFLPFFHTVDGVLKARILKWFVILFSSGPCFVSCRGMNQQWPAFWSGVLAAAVLGGMSCWHKSFCH